MNVLNGSKSRKLAFNGDAKNLDEETLNHNPGLFVKTKCHTLTKKKSLKKSVKKWKNDIKMYTLSIDGIE